MSAQEATFNATERALIAYIASGPHVTLAGGSSNEVFRMLEGLGLSVFTWRGDEESFRASLHKSYTTKGLIVRLPPPRRLSFAPAFSWAKLCDC